jgi:hypoxanthine-DNA glycosylase
MARVCSFPPLADGDAEVLILGSMPGEASLKAQQYYAHPHNTFWRILGTLLGFDPTLPYGQRIARLSGARIALWDVLHSCTRDGSLDTAIIATSETANDLAGFLATHPRIKRVFFNGAKAEASFKRYIVTLPDLTYLRLPSTSPAHATLSFSQKLEAWRVILPDHAR